MRYLRLFSYWVIAVTIGGLEAWTAADYMHPDDEDGSPSVSRSEMRSGQQLKEDPVARLNQRIVDGKSRLVFEGSHGYLRSVLKELNVPIESQMLVFSKTSGQASLISPQNPRALFFSDSVAVGWVPGGFIEVAEDDPKQGVAFYSLEQAPRDRPAFARRYSCLGCHMSYLKRGGAEMIIRSVFTARDGRPIPQLGQHFSDHRSPYQERWGGWYVTAKQATLQQMGNETVAKIHRQNAPRRKGSHIPESLRGRLDTRLYLSPSSDIVALMVFNHQIYMTNLLHRTAWQAFLSSAQYGEMETGLITTNIDRQTHPSEDISESVNELVDYLLFVDEAPLTSQVIGSSEFARRFAELGPYSAHGRSLRQFDLRRRVMRYPCSYMIYSPAFEELPDEMKQAIYMRMWQVLSGQVKDKKYERLSLSDRLAVVDILRDTKPNLPGYFRSVEQ